MQLAALHGDIDLAAALIPSDRFEFETKSFFENLRHEIPRRSRARAAAPWRLGRAADIFKRLVRTVRSHVKLRRTRCARADPGEFPPVECCHVANEHLLGRSATSQRAQR